MSQGMAALGESSSAASTGWRTGTSAACTRRTPRWRSRTRATSTRAATRRVSIWVVRAADIVGQRAQRQGAAVRARQQQGLPPPDLLRDPGRSWGTCDASRAATVRVPAAARATMPDPGPPAVRVVRPRAGAGGGHRAGQRGARPDRPGPALARARRRGRGPGPRRGPARLSCATRASSATCLLVEQPNGDFAVTMARQFFFDAWHYLLMRALRRSTDARIAEIAEKSVKEVAYHLERSGDWSCGSATARRRAAAGCRRAVDMLWPYARRDVRDGRRSTRRWSRQGVAADLAALRAALAGPCRRDARGGDAERCPSRRLDAARRQARPPQRAPGLHPGRDAVPAARLSRTRRGDDHRRRDLTADSRSGPGWARSPTRKSRWSRWSTWASCATSRGMDDELRGPDHARPIPAVPPWR